LANFAGRGGIFVRAASARGVPRPSCQFKPAASRSAPAHAIIAPLSVHSAGGGIDQRGLRVGCDRLQRARIAWLAATAAGWTSARGAPKRLLKQF